MAETKSKKQVGFLLSSGSPLSSSQKAKLKGELKSGEVTVSSDRKKPRKQNSPANFDDIAVKVFDHRVNGVPVGELKEKPRGAPAGEPRRHAFRAGEDE